MILAYLFSVIVVTPIHVTIAADCIDYQDYLRIVGILNTPGTSKSVALQDGYVFLADFDAGLQVIDITDAKAPLLVGSLNTPGHAQGVFVRGSRAYLADGYAGFHVIDIRDPKNLEILGSIATGSSAEDVCVAGSNAYVACSDLGLHIINVEDPAHPELVGIIDTPGSAHDVVVSNNLAYIADGSGGLQIVDVLTPQTPRVVGDIQTGSIHLASGVAVNDSLAFLAVKYTFYDSSNGYLYIIDIRDSENPQILSSVDLGYSIDVTLSGTRAFVADGGGLYIIDVANPLDPEILAWANTSSYAIDMICEGSLVYLADNEAGLKVISIKNVDGPPVSGEVGASGIWDIFLAGDYAYAALPSLNRFDVIDVTDPQNPHVVGNAETLEGAYHIGVAGSVACLAVGSSGLQLIDVSNPKDPNTVGSVNTPDTANGVAVSGHYAFVADWNSGIQVVNIENPTSPELVSGLDLPGTAFDIVIVGNNAFVASYSAGVQVLDVSDPLNLQIIGAIDTPHVARGVAASGTKVYVADQSSLQIIDMQEPATPQIIGSVELSGYSTSVAVSGTTAYVADQTVGLYVIDVANPESPQLLGNVFSSYGTCVAASDRLVAVPTPSKLLFLPLQCVSSTLAAPFVSSEEMKMLVFPNPAFGFVNVRFESPLRDVKAVGIYDVGGRRVRDLGRDSHGEIREFAWDGRDASGAPVSPGIYLIHVSARGGSWTEPVTLLR